MPARIDPKLDAQHVLMIRATAFFELPAREQAAYLRDMACYGGAYMDVPSCEQTYQTGARPRHVPMSEALGDDTPMAEPYRRVGKLKGRTVMAAVKRYGW